MDFYFRVYNKIIKDVKVPFSMKGGDRIDDTPVHKALREALANCLINADYYGTRGVVIKKIKIELFLQILDILELERNKCEKVGNLIRVIKLL